MALPSLLVGLASVTVAKLYFYYSTMNAGKSTALLQASHNYGERGMRTLREDGIRKVLSGMTTAEEVISATMSDES